MIESAKYYEDYKENFRRKFEPWIKEACQENPLLHTWFNLDRYLQEETHGLGHSATVRTTAHRITHEYLDPSSEPIDEDLLDMMTIFHDTARFVQYPENRPAVVINSHGDTKKDKRIQRCIFPHELTGAALARKVVSDDSEYKFLVKKHGLKVFRQLLSHDYHSPEVTPYCAPPKGLEIQILSVADKTSIQPLDEVRRRAKYLMTRPNNPVPFFEPSFSLESRRNWGFEKPAVDALCAIIPIFSYNPKFSDSEGIKKYYQDWSVNLDDAIQETLSLAEQNDVKDKVYGVLRFFNLL